MSLRDQLLQKGLVTADQVTAVEAQAEATVTTPVAETAEPEVALTESDIETGAAFVEALGRKRAEQVLGDEMGAPYGYGRRQDALKRALDKALANRPSREAEPILARIMASPLMRAGRARDFEAHHSGVYAAVESGASEGFLGERKKLAGEAVSGKLVIPKPPELAEEELLSSETRTAKLTEYRQVFEAWRGDRTPAELRALGNPEWYSTERKLVEKWDIARKELERAASGDAIIAAEDGGSLEEFAAALRRIYDKFGFSACTEALNRCSRAWEFVGTRIELIELPVTLYPNSIKAAPQAVWLGKVQELDVLLKFVKEASSEFKEAFRRRLIEVIPKLQKDEVFFCEIGDRPTLFFPDGSYHQGYGNEGAPKGAYTHTTQPGPAGWFRLDNYGFKWHDASTWKALETVRAARRGSVFVTPEAVARFSRHPEKGYPRLDWFIRAGGGKASFELPLQQFNNQLGELVERIEALRVLQQEELGNMIPADAFWVNCRIGQTKAGKPRLDNGQPDKPAALVTCSGGAMSHGRHGWDGSLVGTREGGGAITLWDRTVYSSGGGLANSCIVAWIPQGETLALDSGKGLFFDGSSVKEIAGAGIPTSEDPSRD